MNLECLVYVACSPENGEGASCGGKKAPMPATCYSNFMYCIASSEAFGNLMRV